MIRMPSGARRRHEARQTITESTQTEQQRKWRASVRTSLETSTGRSLIDWVEVARACPETTPRARQRWLKQNHGLGQNYAMLVLGELARQAGETPRDPATLRTALWSDPEAAAILAALEAAVAPFPDLITGQRKTFSSWSRSFAFAAARPVRGGKARLGLAVPPQADPRLEPAGSKEGWSERLKSALVLSSPAEVDEGLSALLRAAWSQS